MATLLPNVVVGVGVCVCVYGGVAGALRDETPLITKRRAEGFGRGTPTNLSTDPPRALQQNLSRSARGGLASRVPCAQAASSHLVPAAALQAQLSVRAAGGDTPKRRLWSRSVRPHSTPASCLPPPRGPAPSLPVPPLPSPSLGSPRLQLSQRTLSPSALWSLPDKPRVRST